ncbi:MAG TPA: hypothetical protein PLW48_06770, partial [Alphaproteobacteria bacterium]|nr:hypothetical protein [Alphaproteobacteria bacterium]
EIIIATFIRNRVFFILTAITRREVQKHDSRRPQPSAEATRQALCLKFVFLTPCTFYLTIDTGKDDFVGGMYCFAALHPRPEFKNICHANLLLTASLFTN